MIAARLANMPAHRPDKSANLPTLSQPQAAKALNISPRSVRHAQQILNTENDELISRLINPLTINQDYSLLAGRRRYQAIKELRWLEVPVRVIKSDNKLFDFKVSIEENLKRKPLTDIEVAIAIKEYDEMKRKLEGSQPRGNPNLSDSDKLDGWTQEKTAQDLIELKITIDENRIRRNLSDIESANVIRLYDEMKRKLEGSARRGERTDLTSSNFDEVWTRDKTAKDLGISTGSVSQSIQIAKAVEEYPELAKEKKGIRILHQSDLDNLDKFVMDCLNLIFYQDDSQIYSKQSIKLYSNVPRTEIELEGIENEPQAELF